MDKKKPKRGIPMELLLLDLSSSRYADDPYRASNMRKELAQMVGQRVLEGIPDGHTKPADLTDTEYLERLAAPEMEALQRSAYERHIVDTGRRNVNTRYDAPGGAREQKKNHQRAYQAAYDSGECTTHASFVEKYAGKPGFNVEARVLARHLKGMPSARKKQTHTP